MLTRRASATVASARCRRARYNSSRSSSSSSSSSTASAPRDVPTLPDAGIDTFRRLAFHPATPAVLPRRAFKNALPAIRKWFRRGPPGARLELDHSYLARFGSTVVPLELSNADHFTRLEQSLSFFLECAHAASSTRVERPNRYFSAYVPGARAVTRRRRPSDDANDAYDDNADFFRPRPTTASVYLAQAPIADLPRALRDDLPAPDLVLRAGRGDVYDSSIWLGSAPTYTPLHRDPNPNLFVQLAGRKAFRLVEPDVGLAVFAAVQERVGGNASPNIRGEEMMRGAEKAALEREVWGGGGEGDGDGSRRERGYVVWETTLDGGDALFIPKGWWHSVKGIGEGMTGSVNWWFR